MYPTTNTRRTNFGHLLLAGLLFIILYYFVYEKETLDLVLMTTRSSDGVENRAPLRAFIVAAFASAVLAEIAIVVITRVLVPKNSHRSPSMMRQDRLEIIGRSLGYLIFFIGGSACAAALIVHYFA